MRTGSRQLEVEVDQCWGPLRQRRARREQTALVWGFDSGRGFQHLAEFCPAGFCS
jgi:hypothetical protein